MPKFARLFAHLQHLGLVERTRFHQPEPASRDLLALAHDPDYVDIFSRGRLSDHAVRRMGLPWSPGLVRRTCTAVSGTLLTAGLALTHGLAAN